MSKSKYFSLIELLVVISILMILASMISPSLMRTISMAKTQHCMKKFNNVFIGIALYLEDHDDNYPGIGDYWNSPHFTSRWQTSSIAMSISPYLETLEIKHKSSHKYQVYYLPSFICPANEDLELSGSDPRTRNQFSQHVMENKTAPFGLKRNKFRSYHIQPLRASEIETPYRQGALSDVFSPYKYVPDLPVHYGYTINTLFLDGHVENREAL